MKAVLVIDIPEEYMGSNIDVKLYGKYQTIHERYVNKLRPLPTKKQDENRWYSEDYSIGWNDCLDEIAGDTDKENLNDTADIIRKWGRYCVCGEKMMPNTAGGWYCPACHRTMKSILFKRVK